VLEAGSFALEVGHGDWLRLWEFQTIRQDKEGIRE
jgi:hypothetical protein